MTLWLATAPPMNSPSTTSSQNQPAGSHPWNIAVEQMTNSASKLLRVETEYFRAGAIWRKIYGIWSCTQAAPKLRWMVGQTISQSKVALLKMGASWQWISLSRHDKCDSRSPHIATNKREGTNLGDQVTNRAPKGGGNDTAPTVASLSLQTGAQPTARRESSSKTTLCHDSDSIRSPFTSQSLSLAVVSTAGGTPSPTRGYASYSH